MILNPDGFGGGTGFHVTTKLGNTYILTNKHVCELAKYNSKNQPYVEIVNGHSTTIKRVLHMYNKHDLCLVEPIFRSGISRISDSVDVLPVLTAGYGALDPVSFALGFKRGEHLALLCVERSFFFCNKVAKIKSDAYSMIVIGGHSGSPILSPTGALVGVIYAGSSRNSLGVPPKYIRDFLENK